MAPEQARGEIAALDERTDVFALGSIFAEVLTGKPAFIGRNADEIHRRAARGDLSPAFARLDAAGCDPELIALAKGCLDPERDDRPRDAGEIARSISSYRAGVEDLRLVPIDLREDGRDVRPSDFDPGSQPALAHNDEYRQG
jgi:serine/threonine protein kinase